MNLGKLIRDERIRQKLTYQKLADMSGFTIRAITYWENGERKMSVENADRILNVLHISVTIGEKEM